MTDTAFQDFPAPSTAQADPTHVNLSLLDDLERIALAWAQEFGFEGGRLPKGRCSDPHDCPLSNAVPNIIVWGSVYTVLTSAGGGKGTLPPRVDEFRRYFDRGHYPHLTKGIGE